jgi:chaperonin cofactor prefoldin
MKTSLEFLVYELKELTKREPPYSDKFVQRLIMAAKQATTVIETYEERLERLRHEVKRLDRTKKGGRTRLVARNTEIIDKFKRGATCIELAAIYGLSKQRVSYIIREAQRRGMY